MLHVWVGSSNATQVRRSLSRYPLGFSLMKANRPVLAHGVHHREGSRRQGRARDTDSGQGGHREAREGHERV